MTQHHETTELILLPSLKAHRGPRGGLVLTRKYLTGAAEYAKYWPGPVSSLVELSDTPTSDMDHTEILPGEAETELELRPSEEDALMDRLERAAIALGFLSPYEELTTKLCARIGLPIVFTSEYSPRTERQIVDVSVRNPLLRWRRKLWLRNAERKRQEILKSAAGVQCSGTPTYEIYRHFNANPLLFFDNRVPAAAVITEEELQAKSRSITSGRPLHLVFGGRLVAIKGVLDLPQVALELRRLGVPFSLGIYGGGELEPTLRRQISSLGMDDNVTFGGILDFDSGWIPLLKSEADLFICCHPQGDPSSTYPEVMSCGVPIAGYDNEAFAGIVEHSNAGWLSPLGDPAGLAAVVAHLHANREELTEAAGRAREFASAHTFEKTFRRRISHLVHASRLPGRLIESFDAVEAGPDNQASVRH